MELAKEIINEVVLAARNMDYGKITISITGQENSRIVDIITEKRERYRESAASVSGGCSKYQKDKF